MSAPNVVSGPHLLGRGFRVTFRYVAPIAKGPAQIDCEWLPHVPAPALLREFVRSGAYEAARHVFLLELSRVLGGAVVCLTPDAKTGAP
jgi:hypothetical protein